MRNHASCSRCKQTFTWPGVLGPIVGTRCPNCDRPLSLTPEGQSWLVVHLDKRPAPASRRGFPRR